MDKNGALWHRGAVSGFGCTSNTRYWDQLIVDLGLAIRTVYDITMFDWVQTSLYGEEDYFHRIEGTLAKVESFHWILWPFFRTHHPGPWTNIIPSSQLTSPLIMDLETFSYS